MAKYLAAPMIYVIKQDNTYLQVKQNAIAWINNPQEANKYASKYAAKEHLKRLTGDFSRIEYEALE
jgi:hypothetical protein